MNMIRRLRRNFILIASAAVVLLVCIVLVTVNATNYKRTMSDINSDLQYITAHGGMLPKKAAPTESGWFGGNERENNRDEFSYQTRYLTVLADKDGNVKDINMKNTASFTKEEAVQYAQTSVSTGQDEGVFEKSGAVYAYLITVDGEDNHFIVIMDCTREFAALHSLWRYSCVLGLACIIVYAVLIAVLSKWIIQPFEANMENQKRFITNAGHELKTPIAIISANAEAIELINGKSQWTDSILKQVRRQTELINALVTMSRIEEYGRDESRKSEIDLTETVGAVAESFKTVAKEQGKTVRADIEEHVKLVTDRHAFHELTNILVDNAVKYCDDGGTVLVSLKGKRRRRSKFTLTVANDYKEGKGQDYSRFFERFYRGDESHNSSKSGFGIGLAMAAEFVEAMKGDIKVSWRNGVIYFTVTG